MKRIQISLAIIMASAVFSCQNSQEVTPTQQVNSAKSGANARILAVEPLFYNVINYQSHGDISISQYIKRARFGFPNHKSTFTSVLIQNISTYRNSLGSIQRGEFDALISDLNSSSYYPKAVAYNNAQAVVYRGGNTFTPSNSGEYRFASPGVVRGVNSSTSQNPARGVSLEVNYGLPYIQNNAYKITYLPAGLTIILAGNRAPEGHSEIVPIDNMAESTYLTKLSQIQTASAQ